MAGGYLGIREINKNVWPASGEKGGVFPNFYRASAPTVRPDSTALEQGDLYYDATALYVRTGSSTWVSVGTISSATLQTVYNNGKTITKASTDAISITDSDTDSTNTFVITKSGAGSGNLIDINTSGAMTGDAINITLTGSGTNAQGVVVVGQATAQTTDGNCIQCTSNSTSTGATVDILGAGVETGPLLQVRASAAVAPVAGTDGMVTIDLTNAAVAAEGMFFIGPAVGRTGACLGITDAGTSTGQLIRLVQTSTSSANVIEYTTSGAVTGDVINLDMSNAGATAQGIVITGQAAAHTNHTVDITNNSTSTGAAIHVNLSNTAASRGIIVDADAAVTGDFILVDMANAGNGADGILLTGSVAGRTGDMLRIVDAATTGTGQSLEIQSTGAKDGDHLLINVDAVATAAGIHMDYDGAATGPVIDIDLDSTGSSVVFDIDIGTGVHTGDIFNFNSSQAYAGDVFDIVLTNCAAGVRALFITGSATTRTAHLIDIDEVGTPSGDTINIAHGGASTGDAIHIDQTNAVAGRALNLDGAGTRTVNMIDIDCTGADTAATIAIDTQGVGASGVATALAINQTTGAPVAGADIVRINNTAVLSSTSNVLALETNAGAAGSFGLYISATSTAEAIKVDDGTCTFDEQITCSGGILLTAATGVIKSATVTLTNAQVLALRATPIEVVAAVGAGITIQFLGGHLLFDYTAAYTESADNLVLRFNNTTGTAVSGVIEATGFADATADAFMPICTPVTAIGITQTAGEVSNPSLVIHNTGDGEWGGGNASNTIKVVVHYVEVTTGF